MDLSANAIDNTSAIHGNIERNKQLNVSNENTSSANVNDISTVNEVNYSAERSNAIENSSANTTRKFSEKSNEASDIVDENNEVAAQMLLSWLVLLRPLVDDL